MTVTITELGGGRRRVSVDLPADSFVRHPTCETDYSEELIERLLEVKGPAWLCDEILRDCDPGYVEHSLRFAILPFVAPEELAGKRMLDFGCGSGASTVVLERLFPELELVGVELEEDLLSIARLRAEHYGLDPSIFLRSPSGDRLPDALGRFDYICFSAVYEHMLPAERRRLLPLLWDVLEPGGLLFLNETPHRCNVMESHTTGLPLLNYLPAPLAHRVALRFSPRLHGDEPWSLLLREGIRGGTERGVLRDIERGGGRPALVAPHRMGLRDQVDLWFAKAGDRPRTRQLRRFLRAVNIVAGGGFVPYLYIAIRKHG
jgi:SAM-dependent methyltransferase